MRVPVVGATCRQAFGLCRGPLHHQAPQALDTSIGVQVGFAHHENDGLAVRRDLRVTDPIENHDILNR